MSIEGYKPLPWYKRLWSYLFGPKWRPEMIRVEPRANRVEDVGVQPMSKSVSSLPIIGRIDLSETQNK